MDARPSPGAAAARATAASAHVVEVPVGHEQHVAPLLRRRRRAGCSGCRARGRTGPPCRRACATSTPAWPSQVNVRVAPDRHRCLLPRVRRPRRLVAAIIGGPPAPGSRLHSARARPADRDEPPADQLDACSTGLAVGSFAVVAARAPRDARDEGLPRVHRGLRGRLRRARLPVRHRACRRSASTAPSPVDPAFDVPRRARARRLRRARRGRRRIALARGRPAR